MQVSSNRYTIQISSPSQSASIISDAGLTQDDKSKDKATAIGTTAGSKNSLFSSTSSLQSALAASALDKSASASQFNYSGPNAAAVIATNDRAIASGLSGGYDLNETLTDKDKAIARYDPNNPASANAANAIADARYRGRLTGDVTADFISNLQNYYNLSDALVKGMESRLSSIADIAPDLSQVGSVSS